MRRKPPSLRNRLLFLLVGAVCFFYLLSIYDFLCLTRRCKPSILVVEGWVPVPMLEKALTEFRAHGYSKILTTGFPVTQGQQVGSDGRVDFTLGDAIRSAPDSIYDIGVTLRGTKARGQFPHFMVSADTIRLFEAFATRHPTKFTYRVRLQAPPRSFHIEFDNDTYTRFTDRELYLFSITVNGTEFPAGNENVSYYSRSNGKYYFEREFSHSTATFAANYFRRAGIPDSVVVAVETHRKVKSKTYTTALDVKDWVDRNMPGEQHITVFTGTVHARRSYISFVRAFQDAADIGIISCPDQRISQSNWWLSPTAWRSVLYETIGVLYAALVL